MMISCLVSSGPEGEVDLNSSWVNEEWGTIELERQ